ncbi:MAG: hypothetical protein M1820_007234 [Bogoriella megaspora]|nr:MAG: hypothetical protein M1820_007234 [Bogoriella megaspora]
MTAFSNKTLQSPKDAPVAYDTFEAKYLTSYLEEYLDSHLYQGRSLRDRIWLNAQVSSIEKRDTGWSLRFDDKNIPTVACSKLAVASGLTSVSIMDNFLLDPRWTAPMIHHRDFGAKSQSILATSLSYRNITVIGGGKSAANMVYAALKANECVSWIIRRSDEGPGILVNPTPPEGYRNLVERGLTVTDYMRYLSE